jgi:lipoyl-dependent peroxiredoxin
MPVREADAQWEGSLQDGKGTMRFGSGAFEGQYTASSRFEDGTGTNPEELIAAAHAACYSMALAGGLSKADHVPESVQTTAHVHIDRQDGGYAITHIELACQARVPGIDESMFQEIAQATRTDCPVSRALSAVPIDLHATLVS